MCDATTKRLCRIDTCVLCFNNSFASHARASCWSKKNTEIPREVFKSSNKKFLFNCSDCNHELELALHNVTKGQWCKYCSNNGLCQDHNCEFCFNKSFASHPMSDSWSRKNTFTPRDVGIRSDKKAWFDCKDCKHTLEISLFSINSEKVCVYCSNQRVCKEKSCSYCFPKTIAALPIGSRWSYKNVDKPWEVFQQSNKKYLFNCEKCSHEYETTPNHVVNRNGSCAFCVSTVLCKDESCKQCFNKSFASSPKVSCWSSKNKLKPRECFGSSNTKIIFNCETCTGEFETQLYNVKTGYWCPFCKNKTEGILYTFLLNENSEWKRQVMFNWCRNEATNKHMPFDFYLESSKLLVELDGRQHFEKVANWGTIEETQRRDSLKNKKVLENGYTLIRLLQEDVWNDTYDWRIELRNEIVGVSSTPQVIFMEKGHMYDTQLKALQD
jgi:very-short-patch-repair endonuclease